MTRTHGGRDTAVDDLIDRICQSPDIPITRARERMLRALARRRDDPSLPPMRHSKVTASRLRRILDYYFDKTLQGRAEKHRLTLPLGQRGRSKSYTIEREQNVSQLKCVEHFWDAHCVQRPDREELLVIHTEPLFFWVPKDRCFVRFLDVNWESTDRIPAFELEKVSSRFAPEDLIPSFHYRPSGEVGARDHILRFFRRYDVVKQKAMTIVSQTSRECPQADKLWHRNLILLGNRRTNALFKRLQDERADELAMTLSDHAIECKDAEPRDDSSEYAFALLTRMPNRAPIGVVTTIGANHGRAAEKVAEFLMDEKQLKGFYDTHGIDKSKPLPATFQILFGVKILDFDNPVEVTPVESTIAAAATARPLKLTRSKARTAGARE
jgi:hypothetical protein